MAKSNKKQAQKDSSKEPLGNSGEKPKKGSPGSTKVPRDSVGESLGTNGEEQPKKDTTILESGDEFLIAGLGASAGGIQAFQQFFQRVPANSGIAYVVILHMSPDHDSHLAQVLQTTTKMPVTQVNERVKVHPNHVYVVPPNQHLTMQDGHINVSPNVEIEDRRAPVDIFFRTLAEEHDSRAIAVILSGTGANGSMGLKRVKEKGGATFVQNPREAEFNEMPRNAIATGLVDEVLNVSDIPAKILAYKDNRGKIQIAEDAEKRPLDQQQALREIFAELRLKTGHDFTNYKRPTLLRRIERRINIHNLPDLPSYVTHMHENPDEIHALLKDMLISVTNFFRDKKAYEIIENEVLPHLLKGKNSENQLRIWVAGCATGEEAYSLAILCAEKVSGLIDAPKVQIFATDIDESAITEAREGLYSINDLADVSPERLRRFFIKEGDNYHIRREVREMIMFANHNFIKDPPFSHLDLISCRNVMIYLNHVAQERVAETFHFALNPGGFLFLGTSESVDGATDLYASYNRENHIFQSRQATPRAYPIPESVPNFRIDKPNLSVTQEHESKQLERISFGDLHQQLLEQYGPPSVVVNEEYDIVHLSERAGRFLQIGGGEPSENLLKLVRPELRLELRSALYQAVQQQSAVEARGVKINIDKKPEIVNIHVRPVLRQGDTARGFILVLFETPTDGTNGTREQEVLLASDEPVARHLEEELMRLKTQLRTSSEQHEFQQEELKASNEELQAMNEELRSAAEELETSKEELQSINEELRTVNQELKVKIEETSLTSNNLQNLINSTDIGTIFLDRSFRVSLFTPAVRNIFNLIPSDQGRPLSDITSKLNYGDLMHNAEEVLEKLTTIEKEVDTNDGKVFLMRLRPYRTTEDRINGVVVTFVNITERKQAQKATEEDLKATQTLHTLSTKLVSEENFSVLYDEVMAAAIDITKADAGTVQIYDDATEELVLLATRGFSKKTMEHFQRINAASNTSCGRALQQVERSFIDFDDPDGGDPDGSMAIHVQEGYLSAQSTPLVARSGKIIGMISTHWREHHHRSTDTELRYLDLLARQASDLIEQLQTTKELKRNMDELSRFNKAMVNRESRMIELKKEINEFCSRLGEPARYRLDFENDKNKT